MSRDQVREEVNELMDALAEYRARSPMTQSELEGWWPSLSPGLRDSFDKRIAPAIMAIVDDAAPEGIPS